MPRLRWIVLALSLAGCVHRESASDPILFRAGTAKAKVTPREFLMMAGYGARNKPAEGTAEDLWVRAVALEDGWSHRAVIVTADIIGFGPAISRKIKHEARARYGLGEDQILLVGSHTHNGPVIRERALVDHPDQVSEKDTYADFLRREVLKVVGDALGNLAPAGLSFARTDADFGMNRRVRHPDGTWRFGKNSDALTDPDVPVLRVKSPSGALRAVLFTYACHCTSVRNGFDGFYRYHPDWAICSARLEAEHSGAQFMFVTGCGGDIDPQPTGSIEVAHEHGREMSAVLNGLLKRAALFVPVKGPLQTNFRRIDLPLERPSRETFEKIAAAGKGADLKFAQEMLKKLEAGTAPTSISYPIQVWHIGTDLTLIALAGETCVDYALRLKRELQPRRERPFLEGPPDLSRLLGPREVWVAGYSNEVMCYIPSERVLGEGGYEAGWHLSTGRGFAAMQMAGSGWTTPFAAGVEDRIVAAVHAMIRGE